MDGTKLKVQLIEVDETVERILEISKEYTFKQLHTALQIAMGWKDLEEYYFLTKDFVLSPIKYSIYKRNRSQEKLSGYTGPLHKRKGSCCQDY